MEFLFITVNGPTGLQTAMFHTTLHGQKKASVFVENLKKEYDREFKNHPYLELKKIVDKWRSGTKWNSEENRFALRHCLLNCPDQIPYSLKRFLEKKKEYTLLKYIKETPIQLMPELKVNIERVDMEEELYKMLYV